MLRDGRIAQFGAPREVYLHPVDANMAAFLGEANFIDAEVDGRVAITALGALTVVTAAGQAAIAGSATVLVRPEQITLAAGHSAPGLSGWVVESNYHGHDSVISVAPDQSPAAAAIRIRIMGAASYDVGTPVSLTASGDVAAWPKIIA